MSAHVKPNPAMIIRSTFSANLQY